MSATKKSGVTADQQRIAVAKKAIELAGFMLSDMGVFTPEVLLGLDQHLQGITDGFGIKVEVMKPNTLAAFLQLGNRTDGIFNQLASELKFWDLLGQIESTCFLQPETLAIVRPFIAGLYEGEISTEKHFTPPTNWKYFPVEEAVAAYNEVLREMFGSKVKVNSESVLKLAKQAKAAEGTEGIPIWLKLSTLAKLFGVEGNPLAVTDEGRAAYARIVELFVPEVGKAYRKIYADHGFKNWREGQLSAEHVRLTHAGIVTWQKLHETTDDDFCFAPAGANTGSNYSGHSVRLSRVKIVLSENKFPQDCIMTGGTIATQPDRMSKFEHLGTDCPANAYSPGADGKFGRSLSWCWGGGKLHFDYRWANSALHRFGAASGRFA